jgi:hypothetical protein
MRRDTEANHRRRSIKNMPICLFFDGLEARNLLSTFTVTSVADSGPGSLRQAILDANDSPGMDQIAFNTPGPDYPTIRPLSPLPAATDPVLIDATTEPGFPGRPVVTLDGSLDASGADGLVVLGGRSTVRGLVVTDFGGYGIILSEGGGDSVQGNYVGVDVTGENSRPNRGGGILILGASNNTIGSAAASGGNVLSGNGGDGLRIVGVTPGLTTSQAAGNEILANFIGLDSTGATRIGNAEDGIHLIRANANAIGGTGFGLGNVVSGNAAKGIEIDGDPSYAAGSGGFNRVQGNVVGTNRAGLLGLGNGLEGIRVGASANTIGGLVSGAPNVIANNGSAGVAVEAQRVPVLSNAIYGNSGLGIDLVSDSPGANSGQNAPTISSLVRKGQAVTIAGSLVGAATTTYSLQLFSNPAGENQARMFLGSSVATTGASGRADIFLSIATGVPIGGNVTATATDAAGDTSELSITILVPPQVVDLVLSPDRSQITVDYSTPMDPSRTADPRDYTVTAPRPVGIRGITLSADGRSATIALKKAISLGTFAHVAIDGSSTAAVTNVQGLPLDGDGDGQPGGKYHGTVAVATKLHYTDAADHAVTLQLSSGGLAEAYRASNGNAETVRLYGAIAGRSVLSGSVKGRHAQTPIRALIGLNGAINRLTNPPFVIGLET